MFIVTTDGINLKFTNLITPDVMYSLEITNGDYNSYNYIITEGKIVYDTTNAKAARVNFKKQRALQVDNIEVSYKGNTYQGDETSQNRMTRAILSMTDTEVIPWVTKDNKIVNLSKVDLSAILKQAGIIQTSLWTQ